MDWIDVTTLAGSAILIAGIAMVYIPAAVIVAGSLLLIVAIRAAARAK